MLARFCDAVGERAAAAGMTEAHLANLLAGPLTDHHTQAPAGDA